MFAVALVFSFSSLFMDLLFKVMDEMSLKNRNGEGGGTFNDGKTVESRSSFGVPE